MIIGLIPARYQSSRLPGKPLLKFGNETMIQKVYRQTLKSKKLDMVYVLTDDKRINNSITNINGNVLMVTENCINGTERICIALQKYPELFKNCKYIVNIQGDEPFIEPAHIDAVIDNIKNNSNIDIKCSTLHYLIENQEDLDNSSVTKIVLDANNTVLYFSRNCIPSNKNKKYNLSKCNYYAHIGLYAFDINYLLHDYMRPNTPLQLEEDIELLKLIEQGYKITSNLVQNYEIGVNLQEDYQYLLKKYSYQSQ